MSTSFRGTRRLKEPARGCGPGAGYTTATTAAAAILAALLVPTAGGSADAPTELTIEISGFESRSGRVAIAVFDSAERFEARESPVARTFLPVEGDDVVWTAVVQPAGERLAVLAYHDVNGNGQIDFGRMGIPQEPYGFSNGARRLFGPPDFETASFPVDAPGPVSIRLR